MYTLWHMLKGAQAHANVHVHDEHFINGCETIEACTHKVRYQIPGFPPLEYRYYYRIRGSEVIVISNTKVRALPPGHLPLLKPHPAHPHIIYIV